MTDILRNIPIVRWSQRALSWVLAKNRPDAYLPMSITLLTWNIQHDVPNAWERHQAAMTYIQHKAFGCYDGRAPRPGVIMLQEVCADAFNALLEHAWVRTHFMVMPPGPQYWPYGARYGVVTLVPRHMSISAATSVEFGGSRMGRNMLMVDVWVNMSKDALGCEPKIIRIANTHLESLPGGVIWRAGQLRTVAQWLKDFQVKGGIVCGDMNALVPADEKCVALNGLVDAWEKSSAHIAAVGDGDMEENDGTTWGFQPRSDFKPARLDKMLYTEKRAYELERPWAVGVGLKTKSGQWVSDHYGLMSILRVLGL